mmetsp:Transcript_16243/g.38357  ORF Transcript_16243/g.38357 Transcript_16243/m.38357 type:complete len:412 (-) Transcript_16243:29-1264(-)
MELKVESVEGFNLPQNCFIGVRVGDVLKQGRYEPSRCYHFPQIDRRRNAKVDIYQHVGTCIVAVDPDTKSSHEVAVTSLDPALPGSRIRINVQTKNEDSKQHREERAKALKAQARDYLMKHNVEERLSEAVKALLKEQPADPTAFLCKHLSDGEYGAAPVPAEKPQQPDTEQKPAEVAAAGQEAPAEAEAEELGTLTREDDELDKLRKKGRDTFLRASEDGSLQQALGEIRGVPAEDQPAAPVEAAQPPTDPNQAKKDAIRAKASGVLIAAAENGDLERALQLVKKDTTVGQEDGNQHEKVPDTVSAAAEAPPAEDPKPESAPDTQEEVTNAVQNPPAQEQSGDQAANLPAEAATDGKPEEPIQEIKDAEPKSEMAPALEICDVPPVMVADLTVNAPTFVSFGMQPGFMFI